MAKHHINDDSNEVGRLLEETVGNLRNREADLNARIRLIDNSPASFYSPQVTK